MKKEIKCSYAVLVIILFAALAFVTDYAYIQNKTTKCSCPKCDVSESANVSVREVAGLYVGDINSGINLYLYTDGTYYYNFGTYNTSGELGNYVVNGNNIELYGSFVHGSDVSRGLQFNKRILRLTDNNAFIDDDVSYLKYEQYFEDVSQVTLNKQQNFDDTVNENSKYKELLSNGMLYNGYASY